MRGRVLGTEHFLPADGPTPEKKLARSVIAQAVLDALSKDVDVRTGAEHFLLGATPAHERIREHWFMTAQLGLPDMAAFKAGLEHARQIEGSCRAKTVTAAWRAWRGLAPEEEP